VSEFERLHPAIQHHVVNSLGWRSLRPLQEQSIDPLLAGRDALLIAPTAGGKTEAAVFPLFSRMLEEGWQGLSILYVCPIKALLNNLEHRLRRYAELVGRRVALWHGDVGASERRKIDRDPPDVLLTTPESIEVILTSTLREHERIFAGLRTIVVDELHAFAGDDRGWHLQFLMERLEGTIGQKLQRVGLSATVGNPDGLLETFSTRPEAERLVVSPPPGEEVTPDVSLDYVGSITNAATVISKLHRGEKRLVFVDSRERCEKLAAALRAESVKTFVSHGSLGLDERRQAEQAFGEARDCVIVATSTLELGIDVGDLDRIIQIDAPSTVASFLQRLGRTGRRPGSTRNCLFLATDGLSLLQAGGLIRLWDRGFVEPLALPPLPVHVLTQQIITLTVQERGVGHSRIPGWLGEALSRSGLAGEGMEEELRFMLEEGLLFEDGGVLSLGPEGDRRFKGKNWMGLFSVFQTLPEFLVMHGRTELGQVHESSFLIKQERRPILLLAGRHWSVTHIDWDRRIAWVEPAKEGGKSRWLGGGLPLSGELCRAMRSILADGVIPCQLSSRARERLDMLQSEFDFVLDGHTTLHRHATSLRWWTFAGLRANAALTRILGPKARSTSRADNFYVALSDEATSEDLDAALALIRQNPEAAALPEVDEDAVEGVKFHNCISPGLLVQMLEQRLADSASLSQTAREQLSLG
jgi:ATP-dependent helicase Lhr and Lhr-like helicase